MGMPGRPARGSDSSAGRRLVLRNWRGFGHLQTECLLPEVHVVRVGFLEQFQHAGLRDRREGVELLADCRIDYGRALRRSSWCYPLSDINTCSFICWRGWHPPCMSNCLDSFDARRPSFSCPFSGTDSHRGCQDAVKTSVKMEPESIVFEGFGLSCDFQSDLRERCCKVT